MTICEIKMMTVQQYEASLHWVYDKIEATAHHPEPQIRWLAEDPVVLQANWLLIWVTLALFGMRSVATRQRNA